MVQMRFITLFVVFKPKKISKITDLAILVRLHVLIFTLIWRFWIIFARIRSKIVNTSPKYIKRQKLILPKTAIKQQIRGDLNVSAGMAETGVPIICDSLVTTTPPEACGGATVRNTTKAISTQYLCKTDFVYLYKTDFVVLWFYISCTLCQILQRVSRSYYQNQLGTTRWFELRNVLARFSFWDEA